MLRRTKLEFYCFIIMLYLLLAVSVEYNNRIMFMENDHKFTGTCNLIFIHILLNRRVLVRGVKCSDFHWLQICLWIHFVQLQTPGFISMHLIRAVLLRVCSSSSAAQITTLWTGTMPSWFLWRAKYTKCTDALPFLILIKSKMTPLKPVHSLCRTKFDWNPVLPVFSVSFP